MIRLINRKRITQDNVTYQQFNIINDEQPNKQMFVRKIRLNGFWVKIVDNNKVIMHKQCIMSLKEVFRLYTIYLQSNERVC